MGKVVHLVYHPYRRVEYGVSADRTAAFPEPQPQVEQRLRIKILQQQPVSRLITLMTEHGIITERNATALTLALENDKEHSVRAQLRSKPDDRGITEAVIKLLDTEI